MVMNRADMPVQAAGRQELPLNPARAGLAGHTFRRVLETAFIIAIDLLGLAASFSLAILVRTQVLPALSTLFPPKLPDELVASLWWLQGITLGFFAYEGLYTTRLPFWREFKQLVKTITLVFLVVLAIVSLAKMSNQISRTVIVITYLFCLVILPVSRYAGKIFLARLGLWRQRVLLLGAGKTGELVARAISRDPYLGYEVAGFLEDDPRKKYKTFTLKGRTNIRVLGGFNDSREVMERLGVHQVIVAAPGMPAQELVQLVNRLQREAESVLVIPDLFGVPVNSAEIDYFFEEQVLGFRVRNNLASPVNTFLKRAFDLAVGSVILLISAPLMAAIALAVKLDSPGPVIFAHRRIGRGGREFKCYKFRTMVVNAEAVLQEYLRKDPALRAEWERDFKLKNDPRVTRVGRFLRKTSLDELPQIFNVLKGEMSLVGPRPIIRKEVLRFGPYINDFYLVRPGITGLWQVSGRNDIDYPERVRLESWYVHNWSLWLDIIILIRTVGVVLARRGAY
ncbi:undecaprenyl-phosphate galactose phosphotransferase WbaP [Moorella sp. E306M]|nr:undecaprenyl-phosphate galactose phosphotransferase WbaP [Moorella sp. E306M]